MASLSRARSARTMRMAGWSISFCWKTLRCRAWCMASASPIRTSPAEATAQSSRVSCTISMMVRTPRPSSPIRQAKASSNSTSEEALERLPSLSLSRCRRSALKLPSGRKRGTRKQVSPPGAWASTRKASHMGADMNHLCPVSAYSSPPSASARVVLARTSVPPCFSVIPMPRVTARLLPERDEARIVVPRADLRQPFGEPVRRRRERRHRGVGHGHRADMAALDARRGIKPRRPRDDGPGRLASARPRSRRAGRPPCWPA